MLYNLYIYYRHTGIDSPDMATLHAMQDTVYSLTGIRGTLMRRRDDATTLMEIYEGIGDADTFAGHLAHALQQHGIGCESRHAEWFVPAG